MSDIEQEKKKCRNIIATLKDAMMDKIWYEPNATKREKIRDDSEKAIKGWSYRLADLESHQRKLSNE